MERVKGIEHGVARRHAACGLWHCHPVTLCVCVCVVYTSSCSSRCPTDRCYNGPLSSATCQRRTHLFACLPACRPPPHPSRLIRHADTPPEAEGRSCCSCAVTSCLSVCLAPAARPTLRDRHCEWRVYWRWWTHTHNHLLVAYYNYDSPTSSTFFSSAVHRRTRRNVPGLCSRPTLVLFLFCVLYVRWVHFSTITDVSFWVLCIMCAFFGNEEWSLLFSVSKIWYYYSATNILRIVTSSSYVAVEIDRSHASDAMRSSPSQVRVAYR